MQMTLKTGAIAVAMSVSVALSGTHAFSADGDIGAESFRRHCAVCHGATGEGKGPLANDLVKPPADLTTISQRNNGTFPMESVLKTIRYGGGVSTHGPSDMLPWGALFMIDGTVDEADTKVKALAKYIEALQKPPVPGPQ